MNPCSPPVSAWRATPACGGRSRSPSGGAGPPWPRSWAWGLLCGGCGIPGVRCQEGGKRPGPEAPESSWAPSGVPTRPLGGPRAAVQRPGPGHPRPQCGGTLNAGPGDAAVPTPPQGAGLAEHTGGRSAGSSEQTPLKVKDQTPE